MSGDRLYVVVRRDLPLSQVAVQAAHAVAEFTLRQVTSWDNGVIVMMGAKDEEQLQALYTNLVGGGMPVEGFREPDRQDEMTALAFVSHGRCGAVEGFGLL